MKYGLQALDSFHLAPTLVGVRSGRADGPSLAWLAEAVGKAGFDLLPLFGCYPADSCGRGLIGRYRPLMKSRLTAIAMALTCLTHPTLVFNSERALMFCSFSRDHSPGEPSMLMP
jgi:hypothetical protein